MKQPPEELNVAKGTPAAPDPDFDETPRTQDGDGLRDAADKTRAEEAEQVWTGAPRAWDDAGPQGVEPVWIGAPQASDDAGPRDVADNARADTGPQAAETETDWTGAPWEAAAQTEHSDLPGAESFAPRFAHPQADGFAAAAMSVPDPYVGPSAPQSPEHGFGSQSTGFGELPQAPDGTGPQPVGPERTGEPQPYSGATDGPWEAAAQAEPPELPGKAPDSPPSSAAKIGPEETGRCVSAAPQVPSAETADAAAEGPPPVVFSLLLCVHDTPPRLLRASVRSVLRQTYPHFELCVADDNSGRAASVRALRRLLALDPRVKVRFLMSGSGTASAENRAAKLATGGYLGFLSPGDLLSSNALLAAAEAVRTKEPDAIYTDEDRVSDLGLALTDARNKPDFSPETLRSADCVGSLFLVRTGFFFDCGGFEPRLDKAHRYALALKLFERGARFFHIREVLYHRRGAAAPRAETQALAVRAHLDRINAAYDDVAAGPHGVRIRYRLTETPLVSIIIPNKDHAEDLTSCVGSIRQNTKYRNYEILVVENNSENPATLDCYDALKRHGVRVISYAGPFNYAAINNFAAKKSRGQHLVFLNNDVEIFTPDWLTELLMLSQQPGVGAVGTKLLYPDGTIQHAGGRFGGEAGIEHLFAGESADTGAGYGRAQIMCDVSFVTGALMMTRRESFFEVGGMDEALASSLADADYCLRQNRSGRRTVYTPYAVARHYESKSVGKDLTPEQRETQRTEAEHLRAVWGDALTERYSRF